MADIAGPQPFAEKRRLVVVIEIAGHHRGAAHADLALASDGRGVAERVQQGDLRAPRAADGTRLPHGRRRRIAADLPRGLGHAVHLHDRNAAERFLDPGLRIRREIGRNRTYEAQGSPDLHQDVRVGRRDERMQHGRHALKPGRLAVHHGVDEALR